MEENNKNQKKKLKNVASWIPQIYFDLIARFIPGGLMSCLFVIAAYGPEQSWRILEKWLNKPSDKYPSSLVMIGACLVVAYCVGVLLSAFAHIGFSVLVSFRKCKSSTDEEPLKRTWDMEKDFARKYDFIKIKNHSAGNRITKLKAELNMSVSFVFGFSICYLINILQFYRTFELSRIFFMFAFLLTISLSIALYFHIKSRFYMAVDNYSDLLGFEDNIPEKWKRKETKP